jgi:hypothetical protein
MTTVVDLGPVNWARIWGDRAGLVTPDHLKILNEISAQTHLSTPGYWRNLFASFPEVINNAGQIARLYVNPGQEPRSFTSSLNARMSTPASMNKQVQDKREQTMREVKEQTDEALKLHPIQKGFIIIGREIQDKVPVVKKSVEVVQNVGETVSNIASGAQNLTSGLKQLSQSFNENLSDANQTAKGIMYAGLLLGGALLIKVAK